jgi:Transposase DDE domain
VWHGDGMANRLTRRPPAGAVPSCLPVVAVTAGLDDDLVGQVEAFLRETVQELAPDPDPTTRGRPRILPAVCLWAGVVVGLLHGETAFVEVWRLLSLHGLWHYPRFGITDQAVYKRLAQDDGSTLRRLFTSLSGALALRLAPLLPLLVPGGGSSLAPWATMVVALDEMALDQVARLLPALRNVPVGATALLPGTLTALFDLRAQQFVRVDHRPEVNQNEKVLARTMVSALPRGSLLLADLGYFAFAWFDDLTVAGLFWISRLRAKTSTKVLHVFYQSASVWDGLVYLGKHRADRAAHPVRLVRFTIGSTNWTYITNVLDPCQLSIQNIAVLYARRWDIELAFKLLKCTLGLHLIWSPKPALVVQQLYAVLCLAQLVQALRLELAVRAGIDPFEISLPLFLRHLPKLAAAGYADPLAVLVERGEAAGILRPSRRTTIQTPAVDLATLVPAPPHLLCARTARYANRKCASKPK